MKIISAFFILIASLFAQSTYSNTLWGMGFFGSNPTDVSCIYGSSAQVVRVYEIRVSLSSGEYNQGPGYGWARLVLMRRNGRDSGGSILPGGYVIETADPLDPQPTATVLSLNGTPTTVAPGKELRSLELELGNGTVYDLYKADPQFKPETLRGVNDGLCIWLDNWQPVNLYYMSIDTIWTESPQ